MQMREVEYYRLWEDHTWDTAFIDIPLETPEEQMEDAIRAAAAAIDWRDNAPVVLGLYYHSDDDLEELDDVAETSIPEHQEEKP